MPVQMMVKSAAIGGSHEASVEMTIPPAATSTMILAG